MLSEMEAKVRELQMMCEELIKAQELKKDDGAQPLRVPTQGEMNELPWDATEKGNKARKPKVAKQPKTLAGQPSQAGKPRQLANEGDKRTSQGKDELSKELLGVNLNDAGAELEEIRKRDEAQESLVKELNMKLEAEAAKFQLEKVMLEEEIQFHKSQTENAKKKLEFEQEVWDRVTQELTQEKDRLKNEVQAKEEIINNQEQRIQVVAREMTMSLMRAGLHSGSTGRDDAAEKLLESKQMLAKMHLEYEYEMQKLREFVDRESERHQAEVRRMEQDHKRDLQTIYKDTSAIFRAVNRFKDCLATLLDRESKW